jgi:hypothetical protein
MPLTTPIATARQAFKTILDAASLGVAVERDGLPYGGARDRSIIIQHVTGAIETIGGENYSATEKGGYTIVHLQLDIWQSNRVTRDTLADQVIALIESKRADFKATHNIQDLLCLELHDLPDPETGSQLYRKVIRYKMRTPLTRAA